MWLTNNKKINKMVKVTLVLLTVLTICCVKGGTNETFSNEDCFKEENILCWPKCCKQNEIYSVEKTNCMDWQRENFRLDFYGNSGTFK